MAGRALSALGAAMLLAGVAAAAEPVVVDAGKYIDKSLPDCGLQAAINALPPEGGVVQLPEGDFPLERYLYLKSGAHLRGQREETILRVGKPEERRDLTADVRGSAEAPVAGDLRGLKPGMIAFAWRFLNPGYMGYIRDYRVKEVRGQTVVLDAPSKYELLLRNHAQLSWGMATALAAPAKKGEKTIRVEHPEMLKPGYAFCLSGKGDMWDHHFNVVADDNEGALVKHLTPPAEEKKETPAAEK